MYLHSRANFSITAHLISNKLPISDLGRYARSVSIITNDVDKSKMFSTISGSLKIRLPSFARVRTHVEWLPRSLHPFVQRQPRLQTDDIQRDGRNGCTI